MKNDNKSTGILLISHGSPRDEANDAFTKLVENVAARVDCENVLPTFFSIKRPNILDQVDKLVGSGIDHIVMMPYFLGNGQHIRADIPARLKECQEKYPDLEIEFLPTLQGEPGIEDILTERIMPYVWRDKPLPVEGAKIAQRSNMIIDRRLERQGLDDDSRTVIRRIIHATADFSFAKTVRIHPEAIERGLGALDSGKPIICDVQMVKAGITKVSNEVLCVIKDAGVAEAAREKGCTRAAAAMEKLSEHLQDSIVVIGNAPTALWKIMDIAQRGGPKPALVVGIPVGFVGARESKLALIDSGLCYITNTTFRGGSPVAAAAVNAIASLKKAVV